MGIAVTTLKTEESGVFPEFISKTVKHTKSSYFRRAKTKKPERPPASEETDERPG